jgi:hypothetical protein
MSPASSKTSCAFNTFIQSLLSAWSLPGTLVGGKNYNSAETRQRPYISIRLGSDQHLIRSLMTYVCPTWEYTTDAHLLKL